MNFHNGWHLTTDHPASSYGAPVLVSPDGDAYGDADLLTTRQVASIQDVHITLVQRWIGQGRIPTTKLGDRYYISARDALAIKRHPRRSPARS